MRASDVTILNLVGGLDKVFIIPPFQRNYEWNFEQCDELFNDIENSYKTQKSHYLGNVVYYPGKNNGAAYTELILVDGQQRITTILLLLCAIRDLCGDETIINGINNKYLKNDTGDERFRIRLKQTSYDSKSFMSIVNKTPIEDKENNIIKNYNHFVELIKKSTVSPKELYETIPKLEVVDVNLQIENDLNAVQIIFEKINSTGKRLTPADLIRNYLLLSTSVEEQESLYENYWLKIEREIESKYISQFARDFLIMQTFDDVPDDKIYKMFKEHFDAAKATHVQILNDMYAFSRYYAWLRFEKCPNTKINKIIKTLNFLKSNDVYPLYMYCFDKLYEANAEELRKVLKLLSDFLLRYRITAPAGGSGALRSVVHQLLEKLNSGEIKLEYEDVLYELSNSSAISGRFPDDEEFKKALKESVNVNYARALLLQIEEYETKNITVPLNEVTVEHLMPQTLSVWWKNYLGGEEEALRIQEKYLNCIGNLTPMSAGYNSKNSNRPWNEKIIQIKDVQFCITSEISAKSTWKENDIIARNENIANRACEATISPLPRTRAIVSKNVSEEFAPGVYNLSDIDTPMTNTTVTEIIYGAKVIKVSSWRDFLKNICKIAHDNNPVLFAKIVEENTVHKATSTKNYPYKDPIISKNPNLFVFAKAIDDTGYFTEGTISANRARFYAKQILDLHEITDDFKMSVE